MAKTSDPRILNLQNNLDQIAKAAEELRDTGQTAIGQATGAVAKGIAEAQKKAISSLDNLKNDKSNIRGDNADGWQGFKDDFHNLFAKARVQHDVNQIGRDLDKADRQADKAADEANNAISNSLEAIQAAQVAVLDALETAAYAEELRIDLPKS